MVRTNKLVCCSNFNIKVFEKMTHNYSYDLLVIRNQIYKGMKNAQDILQTEIVTKMTYNEQTREFTIVVKRK